MKTFSTYCRDAALRHLDAVHALVTDAPTTAHRIHRTLAWLTLIALSVIAGLVLLAVTVWGAITKREGEVSPMARQDRPAHAALE